MATLGSCPVPDFLAEPQDKDVERSTPFLTGCGMVCLAADSLLWRPMILHCSSSSANDSVNPGKAYIVDESFDGSLDYSLSYADAWSLVEDATLGGRSTWASFDFDDAALPSWWPGSLNPELVVPTYNKLIITLGSVAGIGLHRDTDPVGKTGEPIISTFLTIIKGRKRVLMLPPGDEVGHKDFASAPFPCQPTDADIDHIIDAGGFLFDLGTVADESPQTLFVPKGWWHWLISDSERTAVLTASVYDRRA